MSDQVNDQASDQVDDQASNQTNDQVEIPTIPSTNWDQRFLSLAKHIASWSKDPSTQCGAVIVKGNRLDGGGKRIVSVGYNGFPQGVTDTTDRLNSRDVKYKMVLHAEDNAIMFAKEDLSGCTIYTWPIPPCARCAGKIIQSGIHRVVAPEADEDRMSRWGDDFKLADEMYDEAGVDVWTVSAVGWIGLVGVGRVGLDDR